MAIAKTASRNVALKMAKLRESIMEVHDELILRKSSSEQVGLEDERQMRTCACISHLLHSELI